MDQGSGFGRRRAAPILSKENWRTWFSLLQDHLEGQEVYWVISGEPAPQTDITPASASSGRRSSFSGFQGLLESEHGHLWRKCNAKARYEIIACLSEDDQDEILEERRARDVWDKMRAKYSKVYVAHAMTMVQEFINFQMTEEWTIRKAWVYLGNLARRIAEVDPQEAHYKEPERRLKHLLSALPEVYQSTKDTILAQPSLSYENSLQLLESHESRLGVSQETAMLARKGARPSGSQPFKCYLCDEEHMMKDCPGLTAAKKAAKISRSGRIEKRSSPPRNRRRSSLEKDDLKTMVKKLSLEIQAMKRSRQKTSKKAFAAQEERQSSPASETSQPSADEDVDEVAHATVEAKGKYPSSEWLLDSCASSHMTDQQSLFRELKPLQRKIWVKVGGGYLHATHVGTAVMGGKKGKQIMLRKVLFVPGLGVNLVSWNQFSQQFGVQPPKFTLVSESGKPVVQTRLQGGVPFIDQIDNALVEKAYATTLEENEAYAYAATEGISPQWELWHRRFAHFGGGLLKDLHKVTDLTECIPIPKEHQPCRVCSLAKMKRHKGKETERKPQRLSLVSIDVCGPLPVLRLGFKWWLEIVDNFSRKKWTFPLKTKDEAPAALQTWKGKAELKSGNKLQAVRSNGARELLALLRQWERDFGISYHTTEAYNSIQNGVVERSIQTSEEHVRAMLEDANMPIEFWPEALEACTIMRNALPNGPDIDGFKVSPEEAFTGIQPTVSHFKVWGCKAVVYMDSRSQPAGMRSDKLMNRGKDAVFIGYVPDTSKMWLFWEPDMGAIKAHNKAVWFEHEKGGDMELNIPRLNQSSHAPVRRPVGRPPKKLELPLVPSPMLPEPGLTPKPLFVQLPPPPKDIEEYQRMEDPEEKENKEPTQREDSQQRQESQEEETQPAQGQKRRRSISDEEGRPDFELRTRDPSMITGSSHQKRSRDPEPEDELPEAKHHRAFISMMAELDPTRQWIPEFLEDVEETAFAAMAPMISHKQEVPIPKSYKEAVEDPKWGHLWKEAIQNELVALESNNTWTPVVPPKGANLVTSKWVFNVKRMISGAINKFKARLVARGFSQKFGVDFQETFAPTVRHDTIRVFMAAVCEHDLELHQVDVNNAFTESTLQEDIFMIPPPGVEVPPNMVFKILRSLYGLKQAARDWNKLCVSELEKMGFRQSEVDPCLLIHKERKIIILTYVDDIPIAAPKLADVLWFKKELAKVFKIKDLGEPEKILGMKITRDRTNGTLKLSQEHFIQENLAKMNMIKDTAHPTLSPIDSYEALKPTGPKDERCSKAEYQSTNGTWMWPMIMTRPDIAFAIGRLSSYVSDPTKGHMQAQKKLSRYLRSSQDLGLMFRRGGGKLIGYSDSDYAMDKADRVSILGSIFFLCGSPVSWMSRKQKSVATSTMEAEYMAMNACAKQSQFLAALLREMDCAELVGESSFQPLVKTNSDTVNELRPVQIMGDNQAALTLVKDAHTHERSKHIDVAYNFVRRLWWQKKIAVEYVPTKEMVADGLTKPKNGPQFQEFVRQLCLA